MRLINVHSITFKEFIDQDIPQYAIVSHRWGLDEITHQDFLAGVRTGHGWKKIEKGCELARQYGLEWLWIDTCSIDKKSSSELSEAINSMFEWYRQSTVCFTFLPDVLPLSDPRCVHTGKTPAGSSSAEYYIEDFVASDWHSRGWTLQELVASGNMVFYNAAFEQIDINHDAVSELAAATGIPAACITGSTHPVWLYYSIAERMSWAASRKCSRIEDHAYCLLGLLNVNMPLLYGESARSFMRLQLELIRTSDDESIFAWSSEENRGWRGLLAPSPAAFGLPRQIKIRKTTHYPRGPYTMTNKGLQFILQVPESIRLRSRGQDSTTVLLPLNCEEVTTSEDVYGKAAGRQIAIRLGIKMKGVVEAPLFEARVFRGKCREDQLLLIDPFGDKPSKYGCSCIVGVPDSRLSSKMQSWTVYFRQDGM